MENGRSIARLRSGSRSPATFLAIQSTTPSSGVGPEALVNYWPAVVRTGWFLAGFVAIALISRLLVEPTIDRIVRRRNRNNPRLRDAVSLYFRALVVLIGIFVGAGVAGFGGLFGNSALIIGAATLAVGVAGQEVIGSLISGTALVFDPEFNVGNYIEWEGGEGTVRSITLRVTRVQTPDGELVTIPNTVLTDQAIVRPFGRGNYRVVDRIDLAYEDDVDEAMDHLEATAIGLDGVLAAPEPSAYVDELGDDAVVVRVHYWIHDPNRREIDAVRSAYARAVKSRLEEADIAISPPPERDLGGRIEVDGTV